MNIALNNLSKNRGEKWSTLTLLRNNIAEGGQKNIISYIEAAGGYEVLLKSNPAPYFGPVATIAALAYQYMVYGSREKCEKILKYGYERYRNKEITLAMLNTFYFYTKQYQKAKKIMEEELKKTPNDIRYTLELARAEFRLKNYDRAIELLKKVSEKEPQYIKPYYFLHRVYFDMGKLKEAKEYIDRCSQMEEERQPIIEDRLNYGKYFPNSSDISEFVLIARGEWQKIIENAKSIIQENMMEKEMPMGDKNSNKNKVERLFFEYIVNDSYFDASAYLFNIEIEPLKNEDRELDEFMSVVSPKTKEGKKKAEEAAKLIALGKYKDALKIIDEALKVEPNCLLLLVQAVGAANDKNYLLAFKYLLRTIQIKDKKVLGFMKTHPNIQKFIDGITKFCKQIWVVDPQWKGVDKIFNISYYDFVKIEKSSDSKLGKAFFNLIMADMCSDCNRLNLSSKHELLYYKYDPNFLIRRTFVKYIGKFPGF